MDLYRKIEGKRDEAGIMQYAARFKYIEVAFLFILTTEVLSTLQRAEVRW